MIVGRITGFKMSPKYLLNSTKRLTITAFAALSCACLGSVGIAQDADTDNQVGAETPEGAVGGFGDINIFPKRVVIDGRRAIATVGLYNKTADSGDYEIEIIDMGMTADGQLLTFDNGLSAADQARVKTASKFIRYSPRRVTLRGSESQVIRLMARAGSDIEPGEYRSHFKVTAIPPDIGGGYSIDDAIGGDDADSIGVTIRPRFGISIPVIVRIGETTLQTSIKDAQLLTARDGSQAIGFTLTRSGTRSAFGDVVVEAKGAPEPIALARGIGVYPELSERQVVVPINPATEPRFLTSGSVLKITYTDDDFEPGAKLAEYNLTLP